MQQGLKIAACVALEALQPKDGLQSADGKWSDAPQWQQASADWTGPAHLMLEPPAGQAHQRGG